MRRVLTLKIFNVKDLHRCAYLFLMVSVNGNIFYALFQNRLGTINK